MNANLSRLDLSLDADALKERGEQDSHLQAWGNHIEAYQWDIWATLTPRFPDCSGQRLKAEITHRFIRRLAHLAERRCTWILVIERSAAGVFYSHLVIAGIAHLSLSEIRGAWTFPLCQYE